MPTSPGRVGVRSDQPGLGILCILAGMTCISINDMLIKQLSDNYPLHQMVFVRSVIGIGCNIIILQFEGGWSSMKTDQPVLHIIRGLAVVFANMAFFAALAAMPLADATALFFVAPLFITLLSIPLLGEQVGPRRIIAVVVGFAGVLIMMRPGQSTIEVPFWVTMLPIIAAFAYAFMQILTRKLGISARASVLAIYLQSTFIVVSALFWLIAGDGRFVDQVDNPSLIFLLRAWQWPEAGDLWMFLALGINAGVIGYTLSQAYRLTNAATVAPFEYVALPLAIFWGWLIWQDWPSTQVWIGIGLIAGAGIYVFVRERIRARPVSSQRPVRRH